MGNDQVNWEQRVPDRVFILLRGLEQAKCVRTRFSKEARLCSHLLPVNTTQADSITPSSFAITVRVYGQPRIKNHVLIKPYAERTP